MKKSIDKSRHKAKRKREKFAVIFAEYALIALILTAVFADSIYNNMSSKIFNGVERTIINDTLNIQNDIDHLNENTEASEIDAGYFLLNYTDYETSPLNRDYTGVTWQNDVFYDTYGFYSYVHSGIYVFPELENCAAFSAITDDSGNLLYSSREILSAYVAFDSDNADNGTYTCDYLNYPQIVQFREDLRNALSKNKGKKIFHKMMLKSAYVNRSDRTLIPKEIILRWIDMKNRGGDAEEETYTINEQIPDGYELVEFDTTNYLEPYGFQNYPNSVIFEFKGTNEEHYNAMLSDTDVNSAVFRRSSTYLVTMSYPVYIAAVNNTTKLYITGKDLTLSGETVHLTLSYIVNAWNDVTKPIFFAQTSVFGAVSLIIAFVLSRTRNAKNKAAYAFEDYQRDLTNALAHDLKTPLTAIGGYAENILDSDLSDEEKTEYLRAIIKNVNYTNSLINKTLELNNMDKAGEAKKETFSLGKLTDELLEKYRPLLAQRSITAESQGNAEITADRTAVKTAVENLISNAVKYTPENGNVRITVSSKELTVTNTVNGKTDTSKLKQPFFKGDASRSGKLGSGLGLSIADAAAERSGSRLELSCTDTDFSARLIF